MRPNELWVGRVRYSWPLQPKLLLSLVWDNENQIEGRVDGQHIVILTQYVKKTKEDSRN